VALVVGPVVDVLAPGTAVPLAEPLSKQPNVVSATARASDTNKNLSHVRNMNAFLLGAGQQKHDVQIVRPNTYAADCTAGASLVSAAKVNQNARARGDIARVGGPSANEPSAPRSK
jgi:hypothetical protein